MPAHFRTGSCFFRSDFVGTVSFCTNTLRCSCELGWLDTLHSVCRSGFRRSLEVRKSINEASLTVDLLDNPVLVLRLLWLPSLLAFRHYRELCCILQLRQLVPSLAAIGCDLALVMTRISQAYDREPLWGLLYLAEILRRA